MDNRNLMDRAGPEILVIAAAMAAIILFIGYSSLNFVPTASFSIYFF